MRVPISILLLFATFSASKAQKYEVTTRQTDSFSIALVKTLNCAADRFASCTGDSIRTTWLMGTDYKLPYTFPGSTMAIVRSRDWDKNVYVEFRGYPDRKSREQGIKELIAKIKKALGDQLLDPYNGEHNDSIIFHGLSIKDRNGYFSMNMELFGSISSEPIYLLGPEREDNNKPQAQFVLLKIYGGIPHYQSYIRTVYPPDPALHLVIKKLNEAALTDFQSLWKQTGTPPKLKKRDTLDMQGFKVMMSYRGGNFSAAIQFNTAGDSVSFAKQWQYYQQALQAALGTEYVYYPYTVSGYNEIIYYHSKEGTKMPRVSLEQMTASSMIIKIGSVVGHPVKAGLDPEDFE